MSIPALQYSALPSPTTISISASSSGDNVVVAGVTGKRIFVTAFLIYPAGSVSIIWKSGTGGGATAIWGGSGIALCGTNQPTGMGGGYNPAGWFATANTGDALNLSLSSGVEVDGLLTYILQ